MSTVTIRDETAAGTTVATTILTAAADRITVREFIRLRVREEVARFNADPAAARPGLVRPRPTGQAGSSRVDWQQQADIACEAFCRNGLFVLIRDRWLDDLDEVVDLRVDDDIAFVKLVPLVGG